MINTNNHETSNGTHQVAKVKKILKLTAIGGSELAQTTGCAGNPTDETCPLHRIYKLIDPNFHAYSGLDCSVVVYDVQQMLAESDDPELVERVTEELKECPGCVDLLDMEGRLRSMIHDACCQDAPMGLKGRIQDMLQAFTEGEDDCCCGDEDADNVCEELLEGLLDSLCNGETEIADENADSK